MVSFPDVRYIERHDGYDVLNLAAAWRGEPDPWWRVRYPAASAVYLECSYDNGLYVGGMGVGVRDLQACWSAIRAAPGDHHRHEAWANGRRLEAGKHALRVADTMIRARLLDAVDGWAALVDVEGNLIDRTDEGTLVRAPEGLDCLLLVVRCPSTGKVYAIRVPSDHKTVASARRWVMCNQRPEVET
jgi:hypothetical protein